MSGPVSWLITGTSRGIGLQIVRQLAADANNVVLAACRNPDSASDLRSVASEAKGKVHIMKLDVSNEGAIKAAAAEAQSILGLTGLDYLVNNAGINIGDDRAFRFQPRDILESMEHNVIGPALMAQHFRPLLEKGHRKVIWNMTSGLASVGANHGAKNLSYSISKAALNMLTYKQAEEKPDFIAFVIDPGWVKTDMGGSGAFLEIHESVTPMLQFVKTATRETLRWFFQQVRRTDSTVIVCHSSNSVCKIAIEKLIDEEGSRGSK